MLEVNAEDLERAKGDADRILALESEYDSLTQKNHRLQTDLNEMSHYKNRFEVSESEI